MFFASGFEVKTPVNNVTFIPVVERRPGRCSLSIQGLYESSEVKGIPAMLFLFERFRVNNCDWLDQDFYLGILADVGRADTCIFLCTDTAVYTTEFGSVLNGVAMTTLATGYYPIWLNYWDSWPDPERLRRRKCSDGTDAELIVDQMANKVKLKECRQEKALPIISIDATVKRMSKRGLLNV